MHRGSGIWDLVPAGRVAVGNPLPMFVIPDLLAHLLFGGIRDPVFFHLVGVL